MLPPTLTKFHFRIRTRLGLVVENLLIPGRDETEAQHRLRQMYRDCEVIECVCYRGGVRTPSANYEDVVNLIARC